MPKSTAENIGVAISQGARPTQNDTVVTGSAPEEFRFFVDEKARAALEKTTTALQHAAEAKLKEIERDIKLERDQLIVQLQTYNAQLKNALQNLASGSSEEKLVQRIIAASNTVNETRFNNEFVNYYGSALPNKLPVNIQQLISEKRRILAELDKDNSLRLQQGSCLCMSLVQGPSIHTANIGDSTAIIFRIKANGEITQQLLHDLHTNDSSAAGKALNQRIMVSRAIGDSYLDSEGLKHHADVSTYTLEDIAEDEKIFLVVASDGATDFDKTFTAMKKVISDNQNNTPAQIAHAIVARAQQDGSTDNISVIVTRVEPYDRTPKLVAVADGHGHAPYGSDISKLLEQRLAKELSNQARLQHAADIELFLEEDTSSVQLQRQAKEEVDAHPLADEVESVDEPESAEEEQVVDMAPLLENVSRIQLQPQFEEIDEPAPIDGQVDNADELVLPVESVDESESTEEEQVVDMAPLLEKVPRIQLQPQSEKIDEPAPVDEQVADKANEVVPPASSAIKKPAAAPAIKLSKEQEVSIANFISTAINAETPNDAGYLLSVISATAFRGITDITDVEGISYKIADMTWIELAEAVQKDLEFSASTLEKRILFWINTLDYLEKAGDINSVLAINTILDNYRYKKKYDQLFSKLPEKAKTINSHHKTKYDYENFGGKPNQQTALYQTPGIITTQSGYYKNRMANAVAALDLAQPIATYITQALAFLSAEKLEEAFNLHKDAALSKEEKSQKIGAIFANIAQLTDTDIQSKIISEKDKKLSPTELSEKIKKEFLKILTSYDDVVTTFALLMKFRDSNQIKATGRQNEIETAKKTIKPIQDEALKHLQKINEGINLSIEKTKAYINQHQGNSSTEKNKQRSARELLSILTDTGSIENKIVKLDIFIEKNRGLSHENILHRNDKPTLVVYAEEARVHFQALLSQNQINKMIHAPLQAAAPSKQPTTTVAANNTTWLTGKKRREAQTPLNQAARAIISLYESPERLALAKDLAGQQYFSENFLIFDLLDQLKKTKNADEKTIIKAWESFINSLDLSADSSTHGISLNLKNATRKKLAEATDIHEIIAFQNELVNEIATLLHPQIASIIEKVPENKKPVSTTAEEDQLKSSLRAASEKDLNPIEILETFLDHYTDEEIIKNTIILQAYTQLVKQANLYINNQNAQNSKPPSATDMQRQAVMDFEDALTDKNIMIEAILVRKSLKKMDTSAANLGKISVQTLSEEELNRVCAQLDNPSADQTYFVDKARVQGYLENAGLSQDEINQMPLSEQLQLEAAIYYAESNVCEVLNPFLIRMADPDNPENFDDEAAEKFRELQKLFGGKDFDLIKHFIKNRSNQEYRDISTCLRTLRDIKDKITDAKLPAYEKLQNDIEKIMNGDQRNKTELVLKTLKSAFKNEALVTIPSFFSKQKKLREHMKANPEQYIFAHTIAAFIKDLESPKQAVSASPKNTHAM